MIDIMITRLIASAVIAVLLGWTCYVTAFVKHKNEAKDLENRLQVEKVESGTDWDKIRVARSSTWYLGYRLALVGLIIVSTVIGWATAYFVSGEYEISWVEDCLVAGLGALVGGLVLDKYIIHPIADGKFFEKVEDPLVDRFLESGDLSLVEKVEEKPKKEKKAKEEVKEVEKVEEAPAVMTVDPMDELISNLTFDEKIKVLQKLKKSI